jgi:beta-glucosidase
MKQRLLCMMLLMAGIASGQPYKDSTQSTETRVQDLLGRMTPEEKFRQLFLIPGDLGSDSMRFSAGIFGLQVNTVGEQSGAAGQMLHYAEGNSASETALKINQIQRFLIEESRLGIPMIPVDEALHGLVRVGATAFPQSIALAATWNTALMHDVASAIADECATRGIRQVLSPVVNVATDVRWGRTEETYGEDPFLVSEMGVAFVSAFEQRGVITTPKHFLSNVGEGGRDSYPIHWNERLLREIVLPPFEACFRRGGSRSVMTAYNSLDGVPCTANDWLLNSLLKDEWGFNGFVISDAGGTGGANVLHFTAANYPDATAKSLEGWPGCDLSDQLRSPYPVQSTIFGWNPGQQGDRQRCCTGAAHEIRTRAVRKPLCRSEVGRHLQRTCCTPRPGKKGCAGVVCVAQKRPSGAAHTEIGEVCCNHRSRR